MINRKELIDGHNPILTEADKASALTADENTTLTAEAIIGDGDLKALKQITAATTTIMELVTEFFEVGALDVSDASATTEDNTEGDDEKPKN